MTDATVHTVGSKVWIQDPTDGWAKAEVVKVNGDQIVVKSESGKEVSCKPSDAPLQNPEGQGEEDMTRLPHLHEPGVLWNLKCRYQLDDIYTYTGTILIAVNPFTALPHLYGTHMMDQYKGADLGELSPHVYAIADSAYRQMRKENRGQSILVSGESGAGKTETSKLIMKYLAYMGGQKPVAGQAEGVRNVEEQVLESNPLLEAFGNAKTVRNDNSSRFGKYVEINFNKAGVISGASIRTYLLERSRVVSVNNPERNYHIFYQLCDGASAEEKAKWRLLPSNEYYYLNQSTCYALSGVDNAEEFLLTSVAMTRVGIPPEDQEALFSTVAAVLTLGNIDFEKAPDDSCRPTAGKGEKSLADAAALLGVEADGLRKALTTRTRQTPEGPIISPLEPKAAEENRDSLAKIIYSKTFDWLVARINTAIGEDTNAASSVGVLDIYGFESFQTNDFEQFCINLANEKLQQHFNQHVFKMEQAEYEREKIDWSYIEFVDNQDVLDMIEGKVGILDLLDETCRFPTSKASDLAQKLYSAPSCKTKRFSKPRISNTAFTVNHYAGDVTYETTNFLDKNKDFVVAEHQNLLAGSTMPFMANLFYEEPAPDAGSGRGFKAFKFNSVGSQFKQQLGDLMAALQKMEPHYVRCIKPNSYNKPMLFENANTLHQLRCGGVLEAVRISCAGFPSRRPYADFVDHFWQLAPELLKQEGMDDKDIAKQIIAKAKITGYQLGETKVFLRAGEMAILDKVRTDIQNKAATSIQRFVRGWLAFSSYRKLQSASMYLQSAARALAARRLYTELRYRNAATAIQSLWRTQQARAEYKVVYNLVLRMQSVWRGRNARMTFLTLRRRHAAIAIQSHWRGYKQRSAYEAQMQAVLVLQTTFRTKLAKRELRSLRMEARESGKLLEDKKALEAKVLDLQNTLDLVQNQRNELRQQVKDEKAVITDLEKQLSEIKIEQTALAAAAASTAAADLVIETQNREKWEKEAKSLQAQITELSAIAAKEKADLERKLNKAQEYINRSMRERSDIEMKFHAMRDDLMTRLQNACHQRDEARGQVLELQNENEQLRDKLSMKERQLAVASAAAAASAAVQASASPRHMAAATPVVVAVEGDSASARSAAPAAAVGTPVAQQATMAGTTPDGMRLSPMMSILVTRAQAQTPGYAKAMYASIDSLGISSGQHRYTDGRSPAPLGAPGAAETEMERKTRELQAKQAQLNIEKRRQEEERLLTAISRNVGFNRGRPLAAIIVFRTCLQWKCFQADRTTMFEKIISVIGSRIENQQDDNASLSYWLSNTVTLLHMLQKNLKPASGGQFSRAAQRGGEPGQRPAYGGILNRSMPGGASAVDASIHGGGVGGFKQVEAKYPALLFKQQLDAFVQKIFPMIRDNVKKVISPMLTNCIHTPKGAARVRGAAGHQDSAAQQALSKSWGEILAVLDKLLATLRENYVPKVLVQALYKQIYNYINVQLFNQLLLRRECCSFSNGEYVKMGLSQVESWIQAAGVDCVGDSWNELSFIRQAVEFLTASNKSKKSLEEITSELCPVLSIQQLYRISTMYWDDRYNTETVSHDVLARMKQQMADSSSTSSSHSFLLDDDSTLPFAAAEVLSAMDDKDLYVGVPVPQPLKEIDAASFAFLERELRFSPA